MILMEDIIKNPNDVLRENAADIVFPIDDKTRKLGEDMLEYVLNSQNPELSEQYGLRPGVGLAASQMGVPIKMTAIAIPMMDTVSESEIESLEDSNEILEPQHFFKGVIINPKIVSESAVRAALETGEGCLSIPDDVEGYVSRAYKITVEYFDLDGNKYSLKLKDYPAIVFQHEIDHMYGKLYTDYINPLEPWHQVESTRYIR